MNKIIQPDLMTPAEVAARWRVDVKTLQRWEKAGKFPEGVVIRTLGGHRRFRRAAVEQMLNGDRP